jgi:hypothetical protein
VRLVEDIQLTRFDRPSAWYAKLVTGCGYEVEDLGDSVVLRGDYELGRYEQLVARLQSSGFQPLAFRSVAPEFDEADFAQSDLLALSFADLDLDGYYEQAKCGTCKRGTAARDYSKRVRKLKTKHKVGMAGIWAVVVHETVKVRAEDELRGAVLRPFDEAGEYYYLAAATSIEQQTVRPEDGLNVRGACSECGRYRYDVFFGPLRYRRKGWNGDDVVYSYFNDALLFTPRAYEVLRSFDRDVERAEPVYLE